MSIAFSDNPHVRVAWYRERIKKPPPPYFEYTETPQERTLETLSDAAFGAGDVTGATVITSAGPLEVQLSPTIAPAAVRSFVGLAESGFFAGLIFHKVVPGLVAETGDPLGTGVGGPGYTIRDEYSPTPFVRGSLGMARPSKDKAGSRWFITQRRQPQLDGRYTHFGQVTGGWEVLDAIRLGTRIDSITIHRQEQ